MKNPANLPRIVAILAASVWLAGCPTTVVRPPEDRPTPTAIGAPDLRGARVFTVDSDASDVQVHVFRGGALARLGHNHVLTSRHLTGRVWWHASLERCGFELEFPVAQLVVDDPQARARAGSEFPGEVPPEDREATHRNMVRPEVMDAQRHPTIRLQSVRIAGSTLAPQITTRITIKGVARDVIVPAVVALDDNRLTATGEFDILQTDFGIEPFKVGLGALAVQDRLHIVFRVVATRGAGEQPAR